MTAHELAKQLLEMPDVPIVGVSTGQCSGEGQNEFLAKVFCAEIGYLTDPLGEKRVWMFFGEYPAPDIESARQSGWLTDA